MAFNRRSSGMNFNNPVMNSSTFDRLIKPVAYGVPNADVMTTTGTYRNTLMLFAILLVGGVFGWSQVEAISSRYGETVWISPGMLTWLVPTAIVTFVLAIALPFFPKAAPFLAPLYAAAEGVVLGLISKVYNIQFHGIVLQAIMITAAVFLIMLFLYSSRIIKVTQRYVMVVVAATMGFALFYVVMLILRLFGVNMDWYYTPSLLSIGITAAAAVIAALNLPLDFNFIEQGAAVGAPKYFQWYGAFGLMVSIVWLYISILRLLALLQDRR